jgi:hypothetical protein
MTPPASKPSTMDIPTQPAFGPEWLVGKFDELQKHIDGRFDNLDERLRRVETGEPGCRADIQGQVNGLSKRVTDLEDQKCDDRLKTIEPAVSDFNRFKYWIGGFVGAGAIVFIWQLLVHQVTIVAH